MTLAPRGVPLPSSLPMPDLVLAADCVYYEPAFPLLVQTLCDLVDVNTSDREPEVLFCYKKRRKADKRFFGMLGKAFTWNEVGMHMLFYWFVYMLSSR